MSYKDETYLSVLLWTADTQIGYVPGGKRQGTESYVRYSKYSKAKTVGEALSLGSKGTDLFNDYEKKILKVLGGPLRSSVTELDQLDKSSLNDTDKVLVGFRGILKRIKAKEIAKKLGVDDKELASQLQEKRAGSSWCESPQMRVNRLMGEKTAGDILARLDEAGDKVTDDHLLQVFRNWAFRQNKVRRHVTPEGRTWVDSDSFGAACNAAGVWVVTQVSREYPQTTRLLSRWLRDNRPSELAADFPFTSMHVNYRFAACRHRDKDNFGPVIVKALGDFSSGGALRYWPDDNKTLDVDQLSEASSVTLDVRSSAKLIDGNRAHEVEAFDGERYSIVFYTHNRYWAMTSEVRAELAKMDISIPTEVQLDATRRLLPPPAGCPVAPAAAAKASRAAANFFKRASPATLAAGAAAEEEAEMQEDEEAAAAEPEPAAVQRRGAKRPSSAHPGEPAEPSRGKLDFGAAQPRAAEQVPQGDFKRRATALFRRFVPRPPSSDDLATVVAPADGGDEQRSGTGAGDEAAICALEAEIASLRKQVDASEAAAMSLCTQPMSWAFSGFGDAAMKGLPDMDSRKKPLQGRLAACGSLLRLAQALDNNQAHLGTALTQYFEALLKTDRPRPLLASSLELLAASTAGTPRLPEDLLPRAFEAAYGERPPRGRPLAEAVFQAQRALGQAAREVAPEPPTVEQVVETREAILLHDDKAGTEVVEVLGELMLSCGVKSREAFHLVQLLSGRGPSSSLVLHCLAKACVPAKRTFRSREGKESFVAAVAQAVDLAFGEIGGNAVALVEELVSLSNVQSFVLACEPQCGTPLLPMCAAPVGGVTDPTDAAVALDLAGGSRALLERRYAGERVQIHKSKGSIRIYDSCQQDLADSLSSKFWSGVSAALGDVEECVLDGVLQQQGLRTSVVAFDCMVLNGRSITREPLTLRRKALEQAVAPNSTVERAVGKEFDRLSPPTANDVRQFLRAAAYGQCSGVVVKRLESIYEAGRTSTAWACLSASRACS